MAKSISLVKLNSEDGALYVVNVIRKRDTFFLIVCISGLYTVLIVVIYFLIHIIKGGT